MAENEEKLKNLLMRVKEESKKAGLKFNMKVTKIMPLQKVETVTDLSSKITVDNDCSHEIKRYLLLGRKAMANIDSILLIKSRDITLLTKVYIVKSMVLPVVMYRYENWTLKKVLDLLIPTSMRTGP